MRVYSCVAAGAGIGGKHRLQAFGTGKCTIESPCSRAVSMQPTASVQTCRPCVSQPCYTCHPAS